MTDLIDDIAASQPVGWPDALWKAVHDPFTYVLQLRRGDMWRFESARLCADLAFVHLIGVRVEVWDEWDLTGVMDEHTTGPLLFDRGVDLRIADIVWVADCPQGS